VAQRLINRRRLSGVDFPVRFHSDHVWRKGPGSAATPWHQDSTSQGADRVGEFNMWVALDEVTPEMGSIRFLTGSHVEGPLGAVTPNLGEDGRPDAARSADVATDFGSRDFLQEHYPRLWELYELSAPLHYRPGDATVHKGLMLHGAPANATDRDRWSYIVQYTPADTRYIGGSTTEDEARIAELALPVDPERNPIVYPGEAAE
jgi:ectoine hydroxylase-related dioxygenase (phytanoyl-CoA dioxygenase family)